jgi:hypothetical protein
MDATTHMVLFRRATSKSVNKHKFHYLLISQAYGDPALTTNDLRIMIEKVGVYFDIVLTLLRRQVGRV